MTNRGYMSHDTSREFYFCSDEMKKCGHLVYENNIFFVEGQFNIPQNCFLSFFHVKHTCAEKLASDCQLIQPK